jgi:hypothetical protein
MMSYFELHLRVVEAVDIPRMDANASDPYCILRVNGADERRTRVIKNCMQPRWNEEFHWILTTTMGARLNILMRDEDVRHDDDMSRLEVLLSQFPVGSVTDQWFDMVPVDHVHKGGLLHLVIHVGTAGAPPFVMGPPTCVPQPGYPPQGYPPQVPRYPPLGYPGQGYPPLGYPPQGYPGQGYPPQGYPPQGYPPQGYPPSRPPVYPPPGYPPRPYPPQGEVYVIVT